MRFGPLLSGGRGGGPLFSPSAPAQLCGGTTPTHPLQQPSPPGALRRFVEVNAFNTFNPNTADGNTDINSKIRAMATHSGFFYIDDTA